MDPPVAINSPLITAMIAAINDDDPAALRSALGNGADPNGMFSGETASTDGSVHGLQLFPILAYTARRERLGLCQMLLESGANPNLQGFQGMSALHAASIRGNCQIVQLLIKHGANVNLANDLGSVPLFNALMFGRRQTVLILLRAGSVMQIQKPYVNFSMKPPEILALNEYLIAIRDSGGWEAHVARHCSTCLGVIARCVGDNQLRARRLEGLVAEQERLAPFRRDVPICWEFLEKEINALKAPPLPEDVMGAILSFWCPPGGY